MHSYVIGTEANVHTVNRFRETSLDFNRSVSPLLSRLLNSLKLPK
jgi:hypothetical protein